MSGGFFGVNEMNLSLLIERIFHKKELKRLRLENEHLVEYNKKLSNHLRLKAIEIKKLRKEVKNAT